MPDIDQSFVKQYESEVHEAYQRKGSLMRSTVRTQNNVVGASTTFQKVGKGSATQKGRNGVITPMNYSHAPVECTLSDWYAGQWVDKLDELKIKHDERRVAVNAGAYALGRKTDEMVIAVTDAATTNQTSSNLSAIDIAKLTSVVTALGARDAVERGNTFGFVSWQTWGKMLTLDQFNRAEYIGPDALPFAGEAFTAKMWMDVIWMPHSGLTLDSNIRKNVLYHKDAIGHAIGAEVMLDVMWYGDRASWWVNNMMSQGAVLIDTDGVQQFLVTENA